MNVGYFIASSTHYLPSILPLVRTTGGLILTFNRNISRYIEDDAGDYAIRFFKNYESLLGELNSLNLDILVHPSFSVQHFDRFRKLKHVQVFHGTSDKPFNFHKSLALYDLITVPGPRMKEEVSRRGLAEPNKIKVVGYPKIDWFLHSSFDKQSLKSRLGIDEKRKVVLYSPTWDDPNRYSSFSKFITPLMRSLKEAILIVKPHPNILKYRPWKIAWAYCIKSKNCMIFPRSANILPFMAIADILITDISSVSHEFLPFDKPIVFFSPRPIEKISEEHRWIWKCGDVVFDARDIPVILHENLHNPDKHRAKRHEALHEIFMRFDGKSAERFKRALMQLTG